MTALPSHIAETVQTTRIYQCLVCAARITPGIYSRPDYAEQVFQEWINRHQHGTAPTTERDTP